MFRPLILAALSALVFYAVLPVAGAFSARAAWRTFRRRFLASREYAPLSLGDGLRAGDGAPLRRRHTGSAEVLQGEDCIWSRGDGATAAIRLKDARIHLLPPARVSEGSYDLEAADESLQSTAWKRLSGLEEGTRLYAAGSLRIERGLPVFSGTPADPLLVLFYDGRDEDLARRVLWAGRHRNEYWNPVTLVSLTAGFLATGTSLYNLLQPPLLSLPAALAAALAFSPVLPFLPPGLVLFSVYRRLWARARGLRARRDLLRFGLEPVVDRTGPEERERAAAECSSGARRDEIWAGLALAVSLAMNFFLAVLMVRALIR